MLSDGNSNIVASTKTGQSFALEGGTLSAGTGIAFPATQSASSNANTLDDYEEGTWTPSAGAQLTVVGTFSSFGTYTKIGRLVTVVYSLLGSTSVATGGGGTNIADNLPFPVATPNTMYPAGTGQNDANAAVLGNIGAGTATYGITAFAATPRVTFTLTYFTT